jgi:transposase
VESTTGWARVEALIGARAGFVLANVLRVPLPPKARRRKTDKLDTARLLREYLNGTLPEATRPAGWWRSLRRLVATREDLVGRRTAVRNWIGSYFAHETWEDRSNLWSGRGMRRLEQLASRQGEADAFSLSVRIAELEHLASLIEQIEARLTAVYERWPAARRLAAIKGIGVIAAVSIAARIGPIDRFADAEQLIAYAGLAPGVRQSDESSRHLSIGGGGTDKQLRHYLIEASVWARQVPRYRATYERVCARRGRKIGRIVVARLMLRSIDKMLRHGVPFEPAAVPGAAA